MTRRSNLGGTGAEEGLSAFVLEHVADGFITLDREFRVTSMNAAAVRINGGRPREDVLGRTHWEEWPASVGTEVERQYRRAMAERVPIHFTHRYHEPPDHDVWLEIDVYPAGDGIAVFYRDVSERVRAEQEAARALAAAEAERARLAAIVAQMPTGVIVAEAPSGRILFGNDRVATIWRHPLRGADGVAEYASYTGFHPDGRTYLPDEWPLARAITAGETVAGEEIEILRGDGTRGIIFVSAAPVRDENGAITAGVVIFEDVTERARVESERAGLARSLAQQVADWQALFDLTPVGLAVADDPECRTIRVNGALAALLEVPNRGDASSGGPNADALPYHVERDGRRLPPEALPLQVAASTNAPYSDDVDVVFRDARHVHLRAHAVPLRDADGAVRGALGAFTDVTEQRRQQRRTQLVADVSSTLAASLDYDETLRRIAQLVVAAVADWCVVDLCEPGDVMRRVAVAHEDPAMDPYTHVLLARPPVAGTMNRALEVCRTGTPMLVERVPDDLVDRVAHDAEHAAAIRALGLGSFMIAPLVARGETYGAISAVRGSDRPPYDEDDLRLFTDIGSRAALAMANAKLYGEAQRLSQAKSDFLATMSHELRTPLNAILGYTSLLSDEIPGTVTPAQRQFLGRVHAAATHLLSLIDDILGLSRLEAGKERVDVEAAELGALLRASAELIEPAAAAKGLTLEVVTPPHPVWLETDATKVRQIVLNLLSNATKFTTTGGVTLVGAADGGEVVIRVHDTGTGIAAAEVERVFESFYQTGHPNTGQTRGTGLGLAVSRRLARLLGGDLTARSALGVGSTFELRVPVKLRA